jgi:uncharacterized protein YfiM (DUF2279 family)
MRELMFVFALHWPPEHAGGDRWLAADKAKHFIAAAFVQSAAFSAFRTAGLSRTSSIVGATLATSAVSVGKELYDRTNGGTPSLKDLTWDAAGMLAATALLGHTER